jgi:GDP-4-dehydro-6-deoxy-D-mannose reductase
VKINKKVLIIGSYGFLGIHVANAYRLREFDVYTLPNEIDIRNQNELFDFFSQSAQKYSFDIVVHLAALSYIPKSIESPSTMYKVNFIGTSNILECLKCINFSGKVVFASSSTVYEILDDVELPLTEDSLVSPCSPYAVSKIACEFLCSQWGSAESVDIVILRFFNIIGPGQSSNFSISNFCKQAAQIKLNAKDCEINVGNTEIKRDFLDVRDAAEALLLLSIGNFSGVYNICSGIEQSINDMLDLLATISHTNFRVVVDQKKIRSNDPIRVFGDNSKIKKDTCWNYKITIRKTIEDTYNYWLKELRNE